MEYFQEHLLVWIPEDLYLTGEEATEMLPFLEHSQSDRARVGQRLMVTSGQ